VVPSPSVSICMPAYNYGHFIEQAIRSAWAQDYRPIELVVVDDGSTDGTWELLERLRPESPIPMTVLKGAHKGVAAAVNLALTAARGDWIAMLHADDYCTPDRISRQMAAVTPDVVLVHSEYVCVDEKGTRTPYDSSLDLPPANGVCLEALLELRADVRSVSLCFRRSALRADAPFEEDLPVEDWQAILRLARAGQVAHVSEPLIFRRVHSSNISFTAHRKKRTFSMKEIAWDVLREVAPPGTDLESLGARHASVVIRNAIAQGAFAKAVDGLRQCFEYFPTQKATLLRTAALSLPSHVWLRFLRPRVPEKLVPGLLSLKRQLSR
jgi:glycosyltransferase involved in cell wall biosynthesis